jgi:hypothetical protein
MALPIPEPRLQSEASRMWEALRRRSNARMFHVKHCCGAIVAAYRRSGAAGAVVSNTKSTKEAKLTKG